MNAADYQNCPDFSTATGAPSVLSVEADAASVAAYGLRVERFCQGYIHAAQARTDLLGTCSVYDRGAAAFKAARKAKLLALKASCEARLKKGNKGRVVSVAIRHGVRVPVYSVESSLNVINRALEEN